MNKQVLHDSYVEGPRWEDFQGFIKKLAMVHNVDVIITSETKSWLRKTTFFTVRGTEARIRYFMRILHQSIEEYNCDREI